MPNSNKPLKQLGLTNLEANIYKTLRDSPNSTVKILSGSIKKPVESLHRSIQSLKSKGFVYVSNEYPKKYNTIPLKSIYINKIQDLDSIFNQLLTKSSEKTSLDKSNLIRYIPDRETHHKLGEGLFNKLKEEVLIIASGTGEFKPSFFESMVRINEAGKKHRIIAMSLDEDNVEKLRIWKKNGIQIRHKKGKDFNIIIYDREIIQISVRIKEGSKEKEGFLIKNKNLASFLAEFHHFLWDKSEEIV